MAAPGAPPPPRPKFRIDPTAPAAPPPPRPPPPAPKPEALPPLPPPPPSARQTPRWVVPVVIAGVVLLAGAAVAVFFFGVGDLVYPEKYLLDEGDAPRGVRLAAPEFNGQETECEKEANPCRLTDDGLDALEFPRTKRPTEAWAEAFDTPSQDGGPLTLLAMKFASSEDAEGWAGTVCAALQGGFSAAMIEKGSVLRDDDVVVVIGARGSEPSIYLPRVVDAVKTKASGLETVCSR